MWGKLGVIWDCGRSHIDIRDVNKNGESIGEENGT